MIPTPAVHYDQQIPCPICNIILPDLKNLEIHQLTHDKDRNALLGHSYTQKPNQCNISFTSFNVCGLSSRLWFGDFKEAMEEYDFISICETKLDDIDNNWITKEFSEMGFRAYVKNRKNLTNRRSGGVLVAVRNDLCKYITQVEYTADFMIVLILD